jgi:M6 family metalloprotease-like protein
MSDRGLNLTKSCLLIPVLSCLLVSFTPSLNANNVVLNDSTGPPPWRPWSVTGIQKLAVICVEFSDVSHTANVSVIRTRLGNMAAYFYNVSHGKISVDFTLFGDKWLRLNNTMEYYGQGSWKDDFHGWDFVVDSVKAWENFVNFSNYDCLTIVHAGDDQALHTNETELLWSKNFCNLGRTSKTSVTVDGQTYSFWGIAYVSEYDEYGLVSHEFGHSLGLPDLYVENRTEAFDSLSLMALGSWNGFPQGTEPAPLDGFSLHMLGWIDPSTVELNSTEEIFQMKSLESDAPSVLKVPLSDTEYYLVEVREKSGYDEYTVPSTSVEVYLIDEMKQSATGIATLLNGGCVSLGSVFSDAARGVDVSFISFNSSTHVAKVGLSSQLLFVAMNVPNSVQCFFPASGTVEVFNANGEPVPSVPLNITIGQSHYTLVDTDEGGKADFPIDFGLSELGNQTIRVFSPLMLTGETVRETTVVFPWIPLAIFVLSLALIIALVFAAKRRSVIVKPQSAT